jgi:hypothetical protein
MEGFGRIMTVKLIVRVRPAKFARKTFHMHWMLVADGERGRSVG